MRLRTRLMALPLLAGLAATLSPLTAQAEVTDPARATSAVTWLSQQTNPDGMLASTGTYADPGLTLDAVLGGVAADAPDAVIDGWLAAVGTVIKERALPDAGTGVVQNTGLIAKALFALDAAGWSTTSFGGINPQKIVLDSFSQGAKPGWAGAPGRPTSVNAFGQAYAMLGAARVDALPAASVSFLAGQQCADGGFPMNFDSGTCRSDTDGTAILIMALRAAQAEGVPGSSTALSKATAWLASQQRANGSFLSGDPQGATENTNTTGLASAALSDLRPDVVAKARGFVTSLQASGGAIAMDSVKAAAGVTAVTRGSWVRATSQAVLAYTPVSFHLLDETRSAPYTMPGNHVIQGRQWRTTCEPYSRTERCRSEIWASVVNTVGGRHQLQQGWAFNNLTYRPSDRELWRANPLGGNAVRGFDQEWTATDARRWRTECDSAASGRNGCRSYAWVTVVSATARPGGGYSYTQTNGWLFNNIVLFG